MSENKHTPGQITALADQFICHPASRSIDKIEMAGEIMRDLLKQRDELLAAREKCRKELSAWAYVAEKVKEAMK